MVNPVAILVIPSKNDGDDDEWLPEIDGVLEDNEYSWEEDNESDEPQKKKTRRTKKEKPIRKTAKDFILNEDVCELIQSLQNLIDVLDHKNAGPEQKGLVEGLRELNCMIGMHSLKEQIINQILFFLQELHDPGTFLHTVLTGPPGTGKTSSVNILAKIYKNLGFLETDNVVKADRADLIGKWLGETALKTKAVLDSAKGGILLIDEVYSLGNPDGGDSYSKECIDTINQYLSEHVDEFMCIIAGYKNKIQECFFNRNSGLDRRFPWRFDIERQNPEELYEIMLTQLGSWTLKVPKDIVVRLIKANYEKFTGNGGDTRNLLDKCKIQHARRAFTKKYNPQNREKVTRTRVRTRKRKRNQEPIRITLEREITQEDFETGFRVFIKGKEQTKEKLSISAQSMYL